MVLAVRICNVEGTTHAVVDDMRDIVALPLSALTLLNERVIAAGKAKAALLKEIVAFKRVIRSVVWQTEVLHRQAAVAQLRYAHLHTLRVTKEVQALVVRQSAEEAVVASRRKAAGAATAGAGAAAGGAPAGGAGGRAITTAPAPTGAKGAKGTVALSATTPASAGGTRGRGVTGAGAAGAGGSMRPGGSTARGGDVGHHAPLSAGDYNRREREALTAKIATTEASLAQRIAERKATVRKYYTRVQARRAENDELQDALVWCAAVVGQRAGIAVLQSGANEVSRGIKVLRALRGYRNLEMIAKAQVEEIAALRAQVAKLRARTFPAFAVVTKRAIGPDEK